ncbi:MAG TPA: hypothetical protein VIN06_01885 [Devosia sp.]
MRKSFAAIAVLVAAWTPTLAFGFMESAGQWTVADLGKSCMAINRSPVEFNFAPFNAMALHQLKTDSLPRVQVFFWPGAFEVGEDVRLLMRPEGKQKVELAAKAETIYHIVTVDPAPEDLLETLTNVASVEIAAKDVQGTLLFETGPMEDVADLMGRCVMGQ